jgi:hypothetical protein
MAAFIVESSVLIYHEQALRRPCDVPRSQLLTNKSHSVYHSTAVGRFIPVFRGVRGSSVGHRWPLLNALYPSRQHLPPSYTGSLTRRGTLAPLSSVEVKTKMWIARPGIYGLSGWRLETEVGELSPDPWRTRTSFSQGPTPGEETIVTVVQCV